MSPQLLRGWHAHEGQGIVWSKKQALLALGNPHDGTRVRIAGILPRGPEGRMNSVTVSCNRMPIGEIRNETRELVELRHYAAIAGVVRERLAEPFGRPYTPASARSSSDSRDLGVGLERIDVCA